MQIKDYLYQKDLWKPLKGKAKRQGTITDEDWEILDRNTLEYIQFFLVLFVKFNISKEKMTIELMETLAKLYKKPSTLNKVFLMKHLFNMKMGEVGSIENHLNEFNTVTNQFSSIKISFNKEFRALLILCSLPES